MLRRKNSRSLRRSRIIKGCTVLTVLCFLLSGTAEAKPDYSKPPYTDDETLGGAIIIHAALGKSFDGENTQTKESYPDCSTLKFAFQESAANWETAYAEYFKVYADYYSAGGVDYVKAVAHSEIDNLDKTHVAYYESRAAFEKHCK